MTTERTTTGRTGTAPRSGRATGSRRGDRNRRGDAAVRGIQDIILTEGLRPGDPLPTENDLCERLDISRSSLREAMRTLVSLDIVEVRHGHGTFVGGLSLAPLVDGLLFRARLNQGNDLRTLREVVQVRIGLDLSVAEDLIETYRGTENPELRGLVARMREQAARGEGFAEADSAFHASLISQLDNQLLQQLVAAFWQIHTAATPLLGIAPAHDIQLTVEAHQDMVDALEAGDVERYHAAVHAHYAPLARSLDSAGEGA